MMDRMTKITRLVRLDELAEYLLEGRVDEAQSRHTAQNLEDAAYDALEAALEGVERKQMLTILDAALKYSMIVETAAFTYGMRAGALLLRNLFSREEPLF